MPPVELATSAITAPLSGLGVLEDYESSTYSTSESSTQGSDSDSSSGLSSSSDNHDITPEVKNEPDDEVTENESLPEASDEVEVNVATVKEFPAEKPICRTFARTRQCRHGESCHFAHIVSCLPLRIASYSERSSCSLHQIQRADRSYRIRRSEEFPDNIRRRRPTLSNDQACLEP